MIRYIFNTSGNYIGFIQNNNLFNPNGEWLGFIFNGNQVYDVNNSLFVGYVSSDDRIVRNRIELPKLRPLRPLRRLRMIRLPYPWLDVFE